MSKEILTEGFMEKLVGLLVKSAVTKKKPGALVTAISKDKELSAAFSDLEDATEKIRTWAEKKKQSDPEFAKISNAMSSAYR